MGQITTGNTGHLCQHGTNYNCQHGTPLAAAKPLNYVDECVMVDYVKLTYDTSDTKFL
jgi:hypothetical protein